MAKSTKPEKVQKNYNIKSKLAGIYSLAVALAELVTVYIMVTQDNKMLLPIAVILGLDSAVRFTSKFVK